MPGSLALLAFLSLIIALIAAGVGARLILPAPVVTPANVGAALVVALSHTGSLSTAARLNQAAALVREQVPGARLAIGSSGLELLVADATSKAVYQLAWQVFYNLEASGIPARVGVAMRRPGESEVRCAMRAALQTLPLLHPQAVGVRGEDQVASLVA